MYNSVFAVWYPMRASLGAELQAVIRLSTEGNEKKGGGTYCNVRSILIIGNELKKMCVHLAGQTPLTLDNKASV